MKTIAKISFIDWVQERLSREGNHRFGSVSPEDKAKRKNHNLDLAAEEDIELIVNEKFEKVATEVIFVPKGSSLTIFRFPGTARVTDTVATVFTEELQASIRGNGLVVIRRYPRSTRR